jgi:hypothetical protein
VPEAKFGRKEGRKRRGEEKKKTEMQVTNDPLGVTLQ